MTGLGVVVLYESYLGFFVQRQIVNAELAMAVAIVAAVIAFFMLVMKSRAAKRYSSLALKTDAFNSVKDVLTSLAAFLGIAFNKFLGVPFTDSVAGVIIALLVFTVAYSITKEASLVLMDACQCEDIIVDIETIAESVKHVREVHDVRMRQLGPYLIGDMHIVVDPDMTVKEADRIAREIEERVKREFDEVAEIKVRVEPPEASIRESK